MKISQAPPDDFNTTVYFVIEYNSPSEAVHWHNTFVTWCNLHCGGHFSISPSHDPKWGILLTQHLIGFTDPSEALLFRLAF